MPGLGDCTGAAASNCGQQPGEGAKRSDWLRADGDQYNAVRAGCVQLRDVRAGMRGRAGNRQLIHPGIRQRLRRAGTRLPLAFTMQQQGNALLHP